MVAHSHLLGGIERHVVALSACLAEAGHTVAYAGPMDSWMGPQMQAAGHDCLHIPMHGMYDPWSAWRLARWASRWQASVLHGHAQRGARYADWASRWSGVPAVVTAHSTNAFGWFRPHMRILAVSGAVRDALLQARPDLPAAQVPVVYSGVPDPGLPEPPRRQPISALAPLRLGLIGRLEAVKGLDIALHALAELGRTGGAATLVTLRLEVIGPDDTAWATQMRALVSQLGLEAQVHFWGARSDVPQRLAELDVLLAPSRREALPLALIEAAAAGRAVLAARVGGVPEIVANGHSGLLLLPDDPAALAQAIQHLLDQPELLSTWGQAARRCYEQQFTLDQMRCRVLAQYQAVQAQAGAQP
jgi:glycosyltransferase involved in cell wall biosynthesis